MQLFECTPEITTPDGSGLLPEPKRFVKCNVSKHDRRYPVSSRHNVAKRCGSIYKIELMQVAQA
ncbi:MAG: hypothetical protein AABZ13_10875, partial [Planctomycetota bacterium]